MLTCTDFKTCYVVYEINRHYEINPPKMRASHQFSFHAEVYKEPTPPMSVVIMQNALTIFEFPSQIPNAEVIQQSEH